MTTLLRRIENALEIDQEFFVCDNHAATGGYESCCGCSEGHACTEANRPDEKVSAIMQLFADLEARLNEGVPDAKEFYEVLKLRGLGWNDARAIMLKVFKEFKDGV